MASNGASGGRSFTAYLELAGKKLLHSLVIHDEHDEVNAFNANLQSPASATDGDECRRAPAVGCAARRNATAMLPAENKSTLYQMRHNGNAFGLAKDLFWNSLVWGIGNLGQNFRRLL